MCGSTSVLQGEVSAEGVTGTTEEELRERLKQHDPGK